MFVCVKARRRCPLPIDLDLDARIATRLTSEDYELVKQIAREEQTDVAELVRRWIRVQLQARRAA
jgi:hypothetical protein